MSVKDVCDLSNFLIAEESKHHEAKKKILQLDAAINQQESRLQHEEEQKQSTLSSQVVLNAKLGNSMECLEALSILLAQMMTVGLIDDKMAKLIADHTVYECSKQEVLRDLSDLLTKLDYLESHLCEMEQFSGRSLSGEISEVSQDLESLRSGITTLSSNSAESKYILEKTRAKTDSNLNLIDDFTKNDESTRIMLRKLEGERQSLLKSYNVHVDKITSEIQSCLENLSSQHDLVQHANDVLKSSQSSLSEVKLHHDNLQKQYTEEQSLIENHQNEIQQLKSKLLACQLERDHHIRQIRDTNGLIQEHKMYKDQLEGLIRGESCKLQSFQNRHTELKQCSEKFEAELQQQLLELDSIKAAIQEARSVTGAETPTDPHVINLLRQIELNTERKQDLISKLTTSRNNETSNINALNNSTEITELRKHLCNSSRHIEEMNQIRESIRSQRQDIKHRECSSEEKEENILQELHKKEFTLDSIRGEHDVLADKTRTLRRRKQELQDAFVKQSTTTSQKRSNEIEKKKQMEKEKRLSQLKQTAFQKHRSVIKQLQEELSEADKCFQENFLRTERALNDTEKKLIIELQAIEQTSEIADTSLKRHRGDDMGKQDIDKRSEPKKQSKSRKLK